MLAAHRRDCVRNRLGLAYRKRAGLAETDERCALLAGRDLLLSGARGPQDRALSKSVSHVFISSVRPSRVENLPIVKRSSSKSGAIIEVAYMIWCSILVSFEIRKI